MKSVTEVPRRTSWADDEQTFYEMWRKGMPTIIIAILLKRSPISIQTKASRDRLDEREIPAYAKNHRLKWDGLDIMAIETMSQIRAGGPNYIEIEALSRRLGRTIDAVCTKMYNDFGSASLTNVAIDYKEGRFQQPAMRQGPPGAPPNTNKRCINSACRQWFWAKDKTRDWKCGKCREAQRGMSENDFDFWVDHDVNLKEVG